MKICLFQCLIRGVQIAEFAPPLYDRALPLLTQPPPSSQSQKSTLPAEPGLREPESHPGRQVLEILQAAGTEERSRN